MFCFTVLSPVPKLNGGTRQVLESSVCNELVMYLTLFCSTGQVRNSSYRNWSHRVHQLQGRGSGIYPGFALVWYTNRACANLSGTQFLHLHKEIIHLNPSICED